MDLNEGQIEKSVESETPLLRERINGGTPEILKEIHTFRFRECRGRWAVLGDFYPSDWGFGTGGLSGKAENEKSGGGEGKKRSA